MIALPQSTLFVQNHSTAVLIVCSSSSPISVQEYTVPTKFCPSLTANIAYRHANMSSTDDVSSAFGELLRAIYRNLAAGHWFALLEHMDWPNKEHDPDVEFVTTLQEQTDLDHDVYTNMLQMLGLIGKDTRYGGWQIKKKPWEKFLYHHLNNHDFRIDQRNPFGKRLWMVKLKRSCGGYNNIQDQIKAKSTIRFPFLRYLRSNLQSAIQHSFVGTVSASESVATATQPNAQPDTRYRR